MLLEYYDKPWDFELLDSGNGFRLEYWGGAVLMRPDPQAIWQPSLPITEWNKAWAIFKPGSEDEHGKWEIKKALPEPWRLKFMDTVLTLKLSPFKHTGVFAEQAALWEWMSKKITSSKLQAPSKSQNQNFKILNLFAYTGGATMVLAKTGATVTHVDASKPAITWANENYKINFSHTNKPTSHARSSSPEKDENSPKSNVRWILDDAAKFVQREIKRGQTYDGIILDPPAFGHSPSGKTWKFARDIPGLLADCARLLSPNARFLILNAYATNSSALAIHNLLEDALKKRNGKFEYGELCLKQKNNRLLSTGIFARWSQD